MLASLWVFVNHLTFLWLNFFLSNLLSDGCKATGEWTGQSPKWWHLGLVAACLFWPLHWGPDTPYTGLLKTVPCVPPPLQGKEREQGKLPSFMLGMIKRQIRDLIPPTDSKARSSVALARLSTACSLVVLPNSLVFQGEPRCHLYTLSQWITLYFPICSISPQVIHFIWILEHLAWTFG